MVKAMQIAILAMSMTSLAKAAGTCPVTLVSGATEPDGISLRFRNAGKLPIRRLEFNCNVMRVRLGETRRQLVCREDNALFYPGTEYTVRYRYPDGTPRPVQVSLKSVTTLGGYVWKASKNDDCRKLTIEPAAAAKQARASKSPK